MRGVRIDLETQGASDQVYIDESNLLPVKKALDEITRGVAGFQNEPRSSPYRYLGAKEFSRPGQSVHTLNAAYYVAPDSSGLSLSAHKRQEFRFPDHHPSELAEAISRAIYELKQR